jgi:small conductance mechanosensitive channel
MTSIITILGTAGLAIGLALKDSLSNVAGGFIILFSKPLKKGDSISFDGTEGIVEEVGILYTSLRTYDNAVVHIPNGKISDGKIINYTEKETRRVDLEYSVGYNCDIDKVRNVIENILNKHESILKDPKPDILVARHDESAIVIFVRPWVKTEDYWNVKFSLNEQIKKEFDKNNIEIPYPQLDIHNV